MSNADHLIQTLQIGVPWRTAELLASGEPLTTHFARVSDYALDIGCYADQLQFGGPKAGEIFNKLVDALAVLSFCPGGVDFEQLHFETRYPDGSE